MLSLPLRYRKEKHPPGGPQCWQDRPRSELAWGGFHVPAPATNYLDVVDFNVY